MITTSQAIAAILTQYDAKQAGKRHYNAYALAIYLRIGDKLATSATALNMAASTQVDSFFNGSLANFVRRNLVKFEATGKYPVKCR